MKDCGQKAQQSWSWGKFLELDWFIIVFYSLCLNVIILLFNKCHYSPLVGLAFGPLVEKHWPTLAISIWLLKSNQMFDAGPFLRVLFWDRVLCSQGFWILTFLLLYLLSAGIIGMCHRVVMSLINLGSWWLFASIRRYVLARGSHITGSWLWGFKGLTPFQVSFLYFLILNGDVNSLLQLPVVCGLCSASWTVIPLEP